LPGVDASADLERAMATAADVPPHEGGAADLPGWLKAAALAACLEDAVGRLAVLRPEQRPARRPALLALLRRVRGTPQHPLRAFALEPGEIAAALRRGFKSLPRLEGAKRVLRECRDARGPVVSLADQPQVEARLLALARRAKLGEFPEAVLARWLLSQTFLLVSTPAAAVADALLAAGHASEGPDGRLTYGALALPPLHADAGVFEEPPLEQLPRAKRDSDLGVFALRPSVEAAGRALPPAGSFEDLGLREELLEGLRRKGLQRPNGLQQRCLGQLVGDGDVIVEAPPGTGKTLALALAALQHVDLALTEEGPPAPHCPAGHRARRTQGAPSASCAGCAFNGAIAAPPQEPRSDQGPCRTCGCSAERDDYGDRICWCDTCQYWGGCWRAPVASDEDDAWQPRPPTPLHCAECGWYLCGACNKAAPCPTRPVRAPTCQVLVLAPTRELALQIEAWVIALGRPLGARCKALIGGTSVRDSIDAVRKGKHVVVGNPGRVFDLISKRHLRVESLKLLLLDEADAMVSRNMKDQVYDIFKCLPPAIQVGCFATQLSEEAHEVMGKFMREAARVLNQGEAAEPWIPARVHHYCMVGSEDKATRLLGLRGFLLAASAVIIFCNTRRMADCLSDQLSQADFTAPALHAELDQRERDLIMREFRTGATRVIICTSEFARGLDNPRVSLVLNIDLPGSEDYLLRAGRCGRFDRPGTVITLAAHQEVAAVRALALRYGLRLEASGMQEVAEALRRRPAQHARTGTALDTALDPGRRGLGHDATPVSQR